MSAGREDVQFGGASDLAQFTGEQQRVLDRDGIVKGVDEKHRWRFGIHGDVVAELPIVRVGHSGRVDQNREVGPARELVEFVDRRMVLLVRHQRCQCSRLRPGGKGANADAPRVELPVGGVAADEADRPLCILQGSAISPLGVAERDAILEHDAGNADGVQSLGYFGTL